MHAEGEYYHEGDLGAVKTGADAAFVEGNCNVLPCPWERDERVKLNRIRCRKRSGPIDTVRLRTTAVRHVANGYAIHGHDDNGVAEDGCPLKDKTDLPIIEKKKTGDGRDHSVLIGLVGINSAPTDLDNIESIFGDICIAEEFYVFQERNRVSGSGGGSKNSKYGLSPSSILALRCGMRAELVDPHVMDPQRDPFDLPQNMPPIGWR
ncbi:hypothetical protein LSM04_008257 [Trypanosoma melophagium]|uniref:uncharacterized protein n=1 Tax=Trypanosoma melophagium TaxID=715481 RepID=UPI00351A25D6|nr:hypothetical protein LSM04_008257 [Trypanosoma melophagium]